MYSKQNINTTERNEVDKDQTDRGQTGTIKESWTELLKTYKHVGRSNSKLMRPTVTQTHTHTHTQPTDELGLPTFDKLLTWIVYHSALADIKLLHFIQK